MRSIVQLAGRVRRHRHQESSQEPNVLLLDRNWRALSGDGIAFTRPGSEDPEWRLQSHRLVDLLRPEQYEVITATPLILEAMRPEPDRNLADLEHARLRALMRSNADRGHRDLPVDLWWQTEAHFTSVLQTRQPFRHNDQPHSGFVLMPDDETEPLTFRRLERYGAPTVQNDLLVRVPDNELLQSSTIDPWPKVGYLDELMRLADEFDCSLQDAALRFGVVELPGQGPWRYHERRGFAVHR